jgi:hypothetical protein
VLSGTTKPKLNALPTKLKREFVVIIGVFAVQFSSILNIKVVIVRDKNICRLIDF